MNPSLQAEPDYHHRGKLDYIDHDMCRTIESNQEYEDIVKVVPDMNH